ncbi:MAG TPA: MFS transporter [Acidimicrobiia bacterium]|jgi:EmrB/QacA subfamily drug resistance transporter
MTPAVPDPRRWVTLAVVVVAALIVVLDNSVLTVAIPTILRDFHTTLPAVEWVITGYALTFASLLIIGGRLADVFGQRRIFVIGAALFCGGSLLAALSWNIPSLIVGEALIEGIGASLMLPTTLSIISTTFHGRERATAFGAWGATVGVGVALGPVVGGFLTTNYTWRWAFGINVIVAPLAILGALLFVRRDHPPDRRMSIDVPGACLIAVGMFLFVFALSEGARYGWFRPIDTFSVAGAEVWSSDLGVSFIPVVMLVAIGILFVFYKFERWKERHDRSPLFEFGQLRHRGFRYGLITTSALAMGQMGMFFVLPVFLQDAKHLSAETNGFWMLPFGVCIVIGSQLGGRLTRYTSVARVVQLGLVLEVIGLVFVAFVVDPSMSFVDLLAPYGLFGFGIGFTSSQLTNVILSDIPPEKSGVASGTNSTVRQVGAALGVAVIGSVFASLTVSRTLVAVKSAALPASLRDTAVAGVHAQGASFPVPRGTAGVDAAALSHALATGITEAVRPALLLAAGFVAAGAVLSLLIPRTPPLTGDHEPLVEALVAIEPIEPDAAVVLSREG